MAPKVSKAHIEQRKSDILTAAKEVFKRKGFEPTTMQDVVEVTGMSRGGVYQYFSGTEEMLREIFKNDLSEGQEYINDLIHRYEKVWDALNHYMKEFEEDVDNPFGIVTYEYFVTSWRNPERKAYLLERYRHGLGNIIQLLQSGVDRGEFTPLQSLEHIASFMINVWDGLILEAKLADAETANVTGQLEALRIYLRAVLQLKE